ncbi:MAG: pentapeptide repeat-containing protein [Trichormus sp. ATA11-4-KO1]|jgi:hypothetical protein|nr:pentapeptide repeat-containing protein [Trichormus sp. ATA11-4-KO1]
MLTEIINTYQSVRKQLAINQNSLKNIILRIDFNQKTIGNTLYQAFPNRLITVTEHLNHENIDNRLAVIYELEQIAVNYPKFHWEILDILTKFVRNYAFHVNQEEFNCKPSPTIPTDIQLALTVIGRRNVEKDQENEQLDLSYTNMRGVNLNQANLELSNLYQVNLSEANLAGANFSGAILSAANLSGANLAGANLCGAILSAANLSGANLAGANLHRANLYLANLQEATLTDAILKGANLREAKLSLTDSTEDELGSN